MVAKPYYDTGTVSVTNGSASVVGSGTSWASMIEQYGRFECAGLSSPVVTITDDTHITLADPWPGTTGSGKAYRIWNTLSGQSIAQNVLTLLDLLNGDNLLELADLSPTDGQLLGRIAGALAFATAILSNGSASAPSLGPASDTNSGWFFPAGDKQAWSTGGVEGIRLDNAQRLLIGLTSANTSGAKLQTKDGLTFPATQVSSSDANTLDDYEKGTYTPNIHAQGGTDYTMTSPTFGYYTKVGNIVFVEFKSTWTAKGIGGGGNHYVDLPFAANWDTSSDARDVQTLAIRLNSSGPSGAAYWGAFQGASAAYPYTSAGVTVGGSSWGSTGSVSGVGFFFRT